MVNLLTNPFGRHRGATLRNAAELKCDPSHSSPIRRVIRHHFRIVFRALLIIGFAATQAAGAQVSQPTGIIVQEGALADLLLVAGDPLENIKSSVGSST